MLKDRKYKREKKYIKAWNIKTKLSILPLSNKLVRGLENKLY